MTTDNKFRPQQYFGATRPIKNLGSSRDFVRIASLGGFGDVTQNLFVYEYFPSGNEAQSQIIIVDCGVGFPEDDAFGVDLQIPDTKYLEDRKNRILGIFITHGHEDHIGAIRFILPILGKSIPIFAPKIAAALIESRLQESQIRANLKVYQNGDLFNVGSFTVDPIRVNHSIPDTFHFAITTPIGIFYHGSDFKFDVFPLDGKPSDLAHIARVGEKKVVALLSDCLGADHEGFSPSESSIAEKFAVSPDTIRWQNNLTKDRIKVGDTLEILPVAGMAHKVQKGDTVYSIAKKYDAQAQAIVDFPFNTFTNDETFALAIGQTVIVPDGIKPAAAVYVARVRQITPDAGSVTASGIFVWPTSGTITQNFTWYHKGIDIANSAAPDVLATDAGTIKTAGWSPVGYGNHVIIDHGNGYRTLYGHLQTIYVVSGQTVNRGARIGRMGSSGHSTGVHTHFEVVKNGVYLNPLNVLK